LTREIAPAVPAEHNVAIMASKPNSSPFALFLVLMTLVSWILLR
jgi:hypothetical protein